MFPPWTEEDTIFWTAPDDDILPPDPEDEDEEKR